MSVHLPNSDPQPRGAWSRDDDEPAPGDRWALVIIWALVVASAVRLALGVGP